ncbi:GntR family transcriptional regulator [Nitratireductor sp. XY-223]|uniref:GntR family transcriptional regulator n=1 Tax=Nitratireductor sp. XY-223 TaxID=2561926 RepID=UPI002484CBA4|nr:GntR family transcriptional regulator [Nitratireductor sp. XY-223]
MSNGSARFSRNSSVPLHAQLTEILMSRIESGELGEGKFPSENALVREYDVSRVTVRQALSNLEERGLVYRRQGLGTFVKGPQISQQLNRGARTIVEAMRAHGLEPEVQVLGLEQVDAPAFVADALGTGPQPVTLLRRVYLHEGMPIALVELYLPLAMTGVGEVLPRRDHLTETTYSVFENEMNIRIKEARHVIHAAVLDQPTADILEMEDGSTCLVLDRTTYSDSGNVLELIRYYYSTDRFQFEITLPRDAEDLAIRVSQRWRSTPGTEA